MKLQKKNEDKRIITIGIVLAIMVIGIGIAAYFGINFYLEKAAQEQSMEESAKLSEEMLEQINKTTVTETPTYVVTVMPTDEASSQTPVTTLMPEGTLAPEITQEPTETPIYAYVETRTSGDTSGLTQATIDYTKASSTRFQLFADYSMSKMFDGKESTCWQEGVSGNGEGSVLYMTLGKTMEVSKIMFKLGNWASESEYKLNSVPKEMTIWLDDQSFDVVFPHSMTEQCVTFSVPMTASEIYIRIDSVYEGSYENTGISEMEVYGY